MVVLMLPNSAQEAAAASQTTKNPTCSFINIPSRPSRNDNVQPSIVITNNTSKPVAASLQVTLNSNGINKTYTVNTGLINKNSKVTKKLSVYNIPYNERSNAVAKYTASPSNRSFYCTASFVLPSRPVNNVKVYRYSHVALPFWLLDTRKQLADDIPDYKGYDIEGGKGFYALNGPFDGAVPVNGLFYQLDYSPTYTNKQAVINNCSPANRGCSNLGTKFYAYANPKANSIPVYEVVSDNSTNDGTSYNRFYTIDSSEVTQYSKYGYTSSVAFWVPLQ